MSLWKQLYFPPPKKAFILIFVTTPSFSYGKLPCPLLIDHAALVKCVLAKNLKVDPARGNPAP